MDQPRERPPGPACAIKGAPHGHKPDPRAYEAALKATGWPDPAQRRSSTTGARTALLDEEPTDPWMDDAQQTARELATLVQGSDAVKAWAQSRIASR